MRPEGPDYRHRSRRPALTPLLLCGAALWAGCAAAYGRFPPFEPDMCRLLALAAAGCGALLAGASLLRRWAAPVLACAFLLLGGALGWAAAASLQSAAEAAAAPAVAGTLTLLADSSDTGFGEGALARMDLPDGTGLTVSARFPAGSALFYGQRFSCRGVLRALDAETGAYPWSQGAGGVFDVSDFDAIAGSGPLAALVRFRMRAVEALAGDGADGAVLQAVACGYRREVRGSEAYRDYQTCGIAHLIAVSGAHLVIVTGLFGAVLQRIGCPRRAAVVMLTAIMAAYLVLSAMPLSALRAAVMSSAGILALFGRRRPSSPNALGLAMGSTVLFDPAASVSVSFALSALATAGIVLFAPLMREWFAAGPLQNLPAVSDALALTASSGLLSQPYACSVFSLLPLASPLANIAAAPLFAPLCGLGLIGGAAGALSLPFAGPLLTAARAAAGLMNTLAGALASLPFAAVPFTCSTAAALGASLGAAALLWASWPRARQLAPVAAAAILAAGALWIAPASGDRIVMLDVGQGDAFLVQSGGRSLLIDTGNRDTQLLRGLAGRHLATLDAVLVTHGDDDHCGSLDVLGSSVQVGSVLLAAGTWSCGDDTARDLLQAAGECCRTVQPLAKGDRLRLGAFEAEVLHPDAFEDGGGNGDSLCLLLAYDGDGDGAADVTALFTGDAESGQLAQMIAEYKLRDVDILKVGHHGSKNALDQAAIEALSPRIALIGVGERNRYGHPHQSTLDLLEEAGSRVLRTDRDGEVECTLSPRGIEVRTMA